MSLSLWQRLDRFPPLVVRLLARRRQVSGGVVALTVEEISKRSGLSALEVQSLSWLSSWDSVPVSKIKKFSEACGIDFASRVNMREQSAYIRRSPTFKYLSKSPDWESTYQPMIKAYVEFLASRPTG